MGWLHRLSQFQAFAAATCCPTNLIDFKVRTGFYHFRVCCLCTAAKDGKVKETEHSASPILSSAIDDSTEEVVIALGGNMGDRVANFNKALALMKDAGINVVSHASLYESAPAYVTNQPKFLNSAVRAKTKLDPHALLHVLKGIEKHLGREAGGLRYGPRPLDLDILFHGQLNMSSEVLTIPHSKIWERPFVLAPLMDLYGRKLANHCHVWSERFDTARRAWVQMGGDTQSGAEGLKRVMPLGAELWDWSVRTHVMGILNVTPDSFSDGGKFLSVPDAVAQTQAMVAAGVDLIDIGAQSTRPHATRLTTEEELGRLLPVVEAVTKLAETEHFYLSVDTFDAKVAREAVNHGVHVINDVSGGRLDPDMYKTVAELGVPYVIMHLRGDPANMQNDENMSYNNVCKDVAEELCSRIEEAESSGVPAWQIITDPGLGFAKTPEQNLNLLRNLSQVRTGLASWSLTAFQGPMLLGPSRKSFLGEICGHQKPEDRDAATVGAVVAGITEGIDVVRVHNVRPNCDAVRVADAIFRPKGSHQRGYSWLKIL